MREVHEQAELRIFNLENYESWASQLADEIRPVMATYEPAYADPRQMPLEHVIPPNEELYSYYGLYEGNDLRAFASLGLKYEPGAALLSTLVVPFNSQRKRWGSALLTICELTLAEDNYNQLSLIAPPQSRGFYLMHGYAPDEVRNMEDGFDATDPKREIHLVKHLRVSS